MAPELWVVTCAPRSRRSEAQALFAELGIPYSRRVLVTTSPDPISKSEWGGDHVIHFDSTEINISKWWTEALDHIAGHYATKGQKWDVLLAESDVRISYEDVETIRRVMREQNCILAGADWLNLTGGEHKVRRDNSPWVQRGRIPGFAFVAAGEAGIRHDPEFRWWLADDDFEWQSRVSGGSVLVSGTTLRHEGTQGELTGDRLQAWHEDEPKFKSKWGSTPAELEEN